MIDRNALLARLELIAAVLLIPDDQIAATYTALCDDTGESAEVFVKFAKRYGQSLDWIVRGDVRGMIARKAMLGGDHGDDLGGCSCQ